MAHWTQKVLKGEELYYYTRKIIEKLNSMSGQTDDLAEALQNEISAREAAVAQEAEDRAAAIEQEQQDRQQAIDDLSEEIKNLKLELKPMAGALYTEYYYDGNTYEEYGQARAAAIAAGVTEEELDNVISHSSEIRALIKSLDPIELEEEPSSKYLYVVPEDSGSDSNNYNEYIWMEADGQEGKYELVGSTSVNLEELSEEDIHDIWNSVFNN